MSERNSFLLCIDFRIPLFPFTPKSSFMLHCSHTKRTSDSEICVLSWSVTNTHSSASLSLSINLFICSQKSSSFLVFFIVGEMIFPVTTSKLAINDTVPCLIYSNSRRSGFPIPTCFMGCLLSKACIPVFSSILIVLRAGRSGASLYVPHTCFTSSIKASSLS